MMRGFLIPALLAVSALAQLPPSGTLSPNDQPLFRAELTRLENLLQTAPDKSAITYQLARTWAAAKQWPETVEWLRKAIDLNTGLDPSRDSAFAPLHGSREFNEILAATRAATSPISHSTPAFTMPEADLAPESLAFDRRSQAYFFGSLRKGKVIRCSPTGNCKTFAENLGTVLGLKLHGHDLWLLSNTDNESALIRYNLASARIIRKYSVTGPGHFFNDLTITPKGEIYLTDTRAAAVWHLASNSADLTSLPGRFPAANGITLSPDNTLLYVSTFPDGITLVDLKTRAATPITRPANLTLTAIDGLYFHARSLIAIQNGNMTPRVVRLALSPNLRNINSHEVLERRNPLFEGITTGVLVGNDFLYMANIQDDKETSFNSITVLRLKLQPRP